MDETNGSYRRRVYGIFPSYRHCRKTSCKGNKYFSVNTCISEFLFLILQRYEKNVL